MPSDLELIIVMASAVRHCTPVKALRVMVTASRQLTREELRRQVEKRRAAETG